MVKVIIKSRWPPEAIAVYEILEQQIAKTTKECARRALRGRDQIHPEEWHQLRLEIEKITKYLTDQMVAMLIEHGVKHDIVLERVDESFLTQLAEGEKNG